MLSSVSMIVMTNGFKVNMIFCDPGDLSFLVQESVVWRFGLDRTILLIVIYKAEEKNFIAVVGVFIGDSLFSLVVIGDVNGGGSFHRRSIYQWE